MVPKFHTICHGLGSSSHWGQRTYFHSTVTSPSLVTRSGQWDAGRSYSLEPVLSPDPKGHHVSAPCLAHLSSLWEDPPQRSCCSFSPSKKTHVEQIQVRSTAKLSKTHHPKKNHPAGPNLNQQVYQPVDSSESVSHSVCPTLCDPMDCGLPGSSVHGILQTRILEWVAMPSSGGIFLTQGLNSGLLHCRQTLYNLNHRRSP